MIHQLTQVVKTLMEKTYIDVELIKIFSHSFENI